MPRRSLRPTRAVRAAGRSAVGRAAFSLIELLIVLMIIAIAMLLAQPMFGRTSIIKLRSAGLLLQADLAYAQSESIAHGDDPRVVVFDVGNDRYHIAAISDPATPITNPIDSRPYQVVYGDGRASSLQDVSISSIAVGGDAQLRFGIYGELDQTTPATVTLAAGGNSVTVTVHPSTGEASIGSIN